MQQCQTNIQLDDESWSERVETARALMFEDGEAVNSTVVQDSLEGASLTLTRVCLIYLAVPFFNFF